MFRFYRYKLTKKQTRKMSVPKSKRGKSKVEFEMTYFKLADGLDNLVENYFWAVFNTLKYQDHERRQEL